MEKLVNDFVLLFHRRQRRVFLSTELHFVAKRFLDYFNKICLSLHIHEKEKSIHSIV